jgi:tetratricopeptide (TPR) repeat protein
MLWSFVRRVVVVLVVVAVVYLLHLLLIAGLLGSEVANWYTWTVAQIAERGALLVIEFQAIAPLFGFVCTLLSGAWAINKTLYYADKNLHHRLSDYLNRENYRLLRLHPIRLEQINGQYGASTSGHRIALINPLSRVLKSYGLPAPSYAIELLNKEIHILSDQAKIAEQQLANFRAATVCALVLRGASFAAQATAVWSNSDKAMTDRRRLNEQALEQFLAALAIDSANLDALELSAKQYACLGDNVQTVRQYEAMTVAAIERSNRIRHGRALRLLAEHYEQIGTVTRLRTHAKPLLDEAVEVLVGTSGASDDAALEKAQVFETFGRIREKLGRHQVARQSYEEAVREYTKISTEFAQERKMRLTQKLLQPSA